jgi:hypothetical protein
VAAAAERVRSLDRDPRSGRSCERLFVDPDPQHGDYFDDRGKTSSSSHDELDDHVDLGATIDPAVDARRHGCPGPDQRG